MEERPVVPQDVTPRWLPGPHIAEQPLHLISGGAEAMLSGPHPDDRYVKHGEVRLATRQEVVPDVVEFEVAVPRLRPAGW
jgi:hypothetical protein